VLFLLSWRMLRAWSLCLVLVDGSLLCQSRLSAVVVPSLLLRALFVLLFVCPPKPWMRSAEPEMPEALIPIPETLVSGGTHPGYARRT
jgi:hypothetical protein